MSLVVKYSLFAAFSIVVNLGAQYLSELVYSGAYALYLAIFNGTLAGFLTKYILDKKYIFDYRSKGASDEARKFSLYTFMGIFTTLIFWGTEIAFDRFLDFNGAKYVGAVIGLSIGYFIKYQLDKAFVFKSDSP